MAFTQEKKQAVIQKMKKQEKDTGSPEVQIGILSGQIDNLTEHFKKHVKDHTSRHGLLKMVGQRRKLLDYLRVNAKERYQKVLSDLNIRK